MELELGIITLILGLIQPFFTAVTSKVDSGDFVKGLISVSFAAVVAVAQPVLGDGSLPTDLGAFFGDMLSVWLTGLISWLGLTSDWTRKVNEATGEWGLGSVLPTS